MSTPHFLCISGHRSTGFRCPHFIFDHYWPELGVHTSFCTDFMCPQFIFGQKSQNFGPAGQKKNFSTFFLPHPSTLLDGITPDTNYEHFGVKWLSFRERSAGGGDARKIRCPQFENHKNTKNRRKMDPHEIPGVDLYAYVTQESCTTTAIHHHIVDFLLFSMILMYIRPNLTRAVHAPIPPFRAYKKHSQSRTPSAHHLCLW